MAAGHSTSTDHAPSTRAATGVTVVHGARVDCPRMGTVLVLGADSEADWRSVSAEEHGRFDVVRCRGLLHREPDPLGLLARLRELVADDGRLELEAVVLEAGEDAASTLLVPHGFGGDASWWWVPGRAALRWMLEAAGFEAELQRETFVPGPPGSFPVLEGSVVCRPAAAARELPAAAGDPPSRPTATAVLPDRCMTARGEHTDLPAVRVPEPVDFDPRGASDALIAFVEEMPYERRTIAGFAQQVAAGLAAGTRVLDLGAGDAPYRELFAHAEYVTSDWAGSTHAGARSADVVASADALPVPDASFDVVLATQLLEHVPAPEAVLAEIARVLRPGGALHLTVPLAWELHELPHDYRRFTPAGLRVLLEGAGFAAIAVHGRTDAFSTLAQLVLNARWMIAEDDAGRAEAHALLSEVSARLAALAPLDARRTLPLGFTASARRPG